jgi:hypothetical protein
MRISALIVLQPQIRKPANHRLSGFFIVQRNVMEFISPFFRLIYQLEKRVTNHNSGAIIESTFSQRLL